MGKQFNFHNDIENIKKELVDSIVSYVTTTDSLPLTPFNKVAIINRYVYSKLRWRYSIYDLTETWIAQNIDNIIYKYIRKWLQLPIAANVTHLSLPLNRLGISFKPSKELYKQCKITVRKILKLSVNAEIRRLYDITSVQNIPSDSIINKITKNNSEESQKQITSKINRTFEKEKNIGVWKNFMELKEQNKIINHILSNCSPKIINMWQSLANKLPPNIYCFIRKALIFCLPNKSNLLRWHLIDSNLCIWCSKVETQLHVLSYCVKCLNRYTWRHDSILNTILHKITRSPKHITKIYADCWNLQLPCPSELFGSKRPDIVIQLENRLIVLELTVCFETNTTKSRNYKKDRYKNLKDDLLVECDVFDIVFIEFTTLGFISTDSQQPLIKLLKELEINVDRLLYKCMETAIRATYFIFCRRNKTWPDTELLNFY